MGNRAVITASRAYNVEDSTDIGVYLHWNGGRDSVEAFLAYCELKGYHGLGEEYGFARLCQVIGNYFGGNVSIGVGRCCDLDCDNWDNGTYIVKGWKIVDRKYSRHSEQQNYDLLDMLLDINEAQPKREQLDKKTIKEYVDAQKEGITNG